MKNEFCFNANSADIMFNWGEKIANFITKGLVLFLNGNLGAGKTTLVKGIISGLGYKGAVKSPTFSIVEQYEDIKIPVYHFDLYRIADPEELEMIGIRDYLIKQAVLIFEWPEQAISFLPQPDLIINFTIDEELRILNLKSSTLVGTEILDKLI